MVSNFQYQEPGLEPENETNPATNNLSCKPRIHNGLHNANRIASGDCRIGALVSLCLPRSRFVSPEGAVVNRQG